MDMVVNGPDDALQFLDHDVQPLLLAALLNIKDALEDTPEGSRSHQPLVAARCSIARARHHLACMMLMGGNIKKDSLVLRRMNCQSLDELLEDSIQDVCLLAGKRNIRIIVDWRSSRSTENGREPAYIYPPLFQLAVECLLDNAGKYSYSGTDVRVFCALSDGDLTISVSNRGVPISSSEVSQCIQPGWRSKSVLHVARGNGVGLSVVNKIMQLHKGELTVLPTAFGITEVQLVFPRDTTDPRDGQRY